METVLKVDNLTKIYSGPEGEKIKALNDISFEVPRGMIFGLLGPNGAGKTTTIKSICGLVQPDAGSISVMGRDVRRQRARALTQLAAVLEGNRNIYWRLTPRENLEFFAAIRGRRPGSVKKEISQLLQVFGLEEKAREPVRKLSRGMQQKLALAVTLITGAPILLLDEPTLGLDVTASYEIRGLLRRIVQEEQRTIIISTHDMNVVQDICQQVVIINEGRIVAHDSIQHLMDLFQVRSYDLAVGKLTSEQRQSLEKLPHLQLVPINSGWQISLDLENPTLLWQALDILGQEQTAIESISRKELNFEKVFIEILGGGQA
ncbi:MAG: ABC transporter ATP-binding protein [Bacillota bacterium]|jgi:ABC-2 type transport system ATP-binding protein|nr:ABC transporter ATP-binding protein [Bacillota bacterium]